MKARNIIWYMAFVAILLGVGQTIAVQHALYFTVWWYDIVMHFLGGLWIALIALWFYKVFAGESAESGKGYLVALVSVVVVGILWEVLEILVGLTFTGGNYQIDTVLDLIMDVAGAVFASRLVFRKTVVNGHVKIDDHV